MLYLMQFIIGILAGAFAGALGVYVYELIHSKRGKI